MIRYPGSKDKISKKILSHFPHSILDPLFQSGRLEYREPFFGGGAIGFDVLESLPSSASVWLNDKDFGMTCLWNSVRDACGELVEMVASFQPTVDAFYKFKEEDGRTDIDVVRTGFQKFALHQLSFSGIGAKAGGPIGGRNQSSEYNVGCRWNADRHALEIRTRSRLLRKFKDIRITCRDFGDVVTGADEHCFIYLDPPYYEKGSALYKYSMSDDDHGRLAAMLASSKAQWVLSYDDHPVVRELYRWASIESVELTYTMAVSKSPRRRKNSEVVIEPVRYAGLRFVGGAA